MAYKWAKRLHLPCLLRGPQCSARATNLKWPTNGQSGNITPSVLGSPNALHGDQSLNGPQVGKAATSPLPSGGSLMLCTGKNSHMAQKWAKRLHHPCLLGGPECSARGTNLKWPKNGQSGNITPAFLGVPNALHREQISNGPQVGKAATSPLPSRGFPMLCTGKNADMAHKWARRLHHHCLLGRPQCSARGFNMKWPTIGESGCISPAFSGVPNTLHVDLI